MKDFLKLWWCIFLAVCGLIAVIALVTVAFTYASPLIKGLILLATFSGIMAAVISLDFY